MFFRHPSLFVALLVVTATSVSLACAQGADAKGKKKAGHRTYFVPPPPAYTPSLAPGIYVGGKTESAAQPEKKDKYQKYVYTREGYEKPKPTQPNPYVTYWGS